MIEFLKMTIKKQKNIALIAHDGKKQDMIQWCQNNKDILKNHRLSGTGTTARMITDQVGLEVRGCTLTTEYSISCKTYGTTELHNRYAKTACPLG